MNHREERKQDTEAQEDAKIERAGFKASVKTLMLISGGFALIVFTSLGGIFKVLYDINGVISGHTAALASVQKEQDSYDATIKDISGKVDAIYYSRNWYQASSSQFNNNQAFK